MDETKKKNAAISLLRNLLRGYTSRNKELERFSKDAGYGSDRGTYKLYRLLVSLKREIASPKTRAWLEPGDKSHPETVEVRVENLRYRRRVRLARWELDFFLDEMSARPHLNINRLAQPEK